LPELDFLHDPRFGALLFSLLSLWPCWRILRRAGWQPLWSLLVLVPVVGLLLVLVVLAHAHWPVLPPRPAPVPPKPKRVVP